MMRMVPLLALAALAQLQRPASALDNGLGLLPPQAWRSWNAFHENFNQSTIHDMIDALADKGRRVGGVPTSLKDLGYDMIGIDEGWEGCGMGINGTQHYLNGTPAVRADFPDLKALVDYGHSKGVKMGFYLNGCSCGEKVEHRINYEGDVALTHALGKLPRSPGFLLSKRERYEVLASMFLLTSGELWGNQGSTA